MRLTLLGSFVAVTMVSFGQSSLAEINSPLRQSETNVYSSQVIAFNAPNFRPEVSFSNGGLSGRVPTSFFEGPINEILRANLDGNHKSTAFQKID